VALSVSTLVYAGCAFMGQSNYRLQHGLTLQR
jgi:hypothetical protein